MEILKRKLSQLNGNSEPGEIRLVFREIAKDLFKNYHILKGTQKYFFVNIEFYFCNKKHLDMITYPRRLDEGKWFFHQSGVDLTFRSVYSDYGKKMVDVDKDFYFGGILVREVMKADSDEVFDGPYKCEWELFDKFDAFTPTVNEIPIIVRNAKEIPLEPMTTVRKFSYTKEKLQKKYKELTENVFFGNPIITFDGFSKLIREELAYIIDKKKLKNLLEGQ